MLRLILIVMTTSVAGSSTRCTADTASNDKAKITCNYPINLNQSKRSFCLIQYGVSEQRTDVVTACSWEDEELLCVFEEGFHFHQHTVSHEFTVELPIQKGIGKFSCDTIPPDMSVTVEKCTLSPTESEVDERVSTPYPLPNTSIRKHTKEKCQIESGKATTVVLSEVIALLGIALIVTFVFYVRNKRRKVLCSLFTRESDVEARLSQDEASTNLTLQMEETKQNG